MKNKKEYNLEKWAKIAPLGLSGEHYLPKIWNYFISEFHM